MKQVFLFTLALLVFITVNAQQNTPKQKSITVTGVAETEVTPDEIYVQVDLREYDKRGVGKINIDTIKSNFLAACKSIGIADSNISVQAYQSNNNYWELKRSRKKNPDMNATISYMIKLGDTRKMDELVDRLDDEATQNFFIAKLDYSKKVELKKQLKINAIKGAKDKATYLTSAIDEHIGGAISITDLEGSAEFVGNLINQSNGYPNKYMSPRYYTNISSRSDNDNNIGFSKLKFHFEVSVEFALQ